MSLMNVANLAFGLASAASQNAAMMAAQRAAQREQYRILAMQEADFLNRQRLVNEMESSGAFDPSARISALRSAFDLASRLATQNQAGALRTAGYRPSDSIFSTAGQRLSESGRLALAQAELGEAESARAGRMRAAQFASPSNMTAGLGIFSQRERDSFNRMVNPAALVQGFLENGGGADLAAIFRKPKR